MNIPSVCVCMQAITSMRNCLHACACNVRSRPPYYDTSNSSSNITKKKIIPTHATHDDIWFDWIARFEVIEARADCYLTWPHVRRDSLLRAPSCECSTALHPILLRVNTPWPSDEAWTHWKNWFSVMCQFAASNLYCVPFRTIAAAAFSASTVNCLP